MPYFLLVRLRATGEGLADFGKETVFPGLIDFFNGVALVAFDAAFLAGLEVLVLAGDGTGVSAVVTLVGLAFLTAAETLAFFEGVSTTGSALRLVTPD